MLGKRFLHMQCTCTCQVIWQAYLWPSLNRVCRNRAEKMFLWSRNGIRSKPKRRPHRQKPWPAAGPLPSGNSRSLRRKAKKQGASAGEGSLPEAIDLF